MSEVIDVSVVIANWNGVELLPECLTSIEESLSASGLNGEVIVVDNGSVDGSLELLSRSWPKVRVAQNSANTGFAYANNVAFLLARAPVIATLNNDVRVERDWFRVAFAALRDSKVGAVATKIVYDADGRINSTGISLDRIGIAHDRNDGDSPDTRAASEVFGACAGAALYRRRALASCGGFDSSYFAYYEDVDLAWRLLRQGWKATYAEGAVARHLYSKTSSRIPGLKSRMLVRNHLMTLAKNSSREQLDSGRVLLVVYIASLTLGRALRDRDLAVPWGVVEGLRAWKLCRQNGVSLGPRLPLDAFGAPESLREKFRRALSKARERRAITG